MRKRNTLWNPPDDEQRPRPAERALPTDPICRSCPNRVRVLGDKKILCAGLCPPMQWVNGNVGLKEALLDEPVEPSSDYNAVLAEGIESHRLDFSEMIAGETNLRKKCVGVLIEADFKIDEIAKVMRIAKRTIYRLKDTNERQGNR